ncbi:MAG: hypothetical protein GQ538_03950 [Xanthomonadales bacterium]|nr:hypothetical protein [Xanthomonadales bacterium]
MTNLPRLMALALTLFAVLSGCSMFGNNEPEYLASEEIPFLKVPEGLDDPRGARQVLITVPQMRMPAGDELEPKPPRVVSTAGKQDANAHMAWSAEGVYLLVKDTPDSVAKRLRYAIDHSGMTMLRSDDASGSHKFHYSQAQTNEREGFFSRMAFWRADPFDYSGTFMTNIREDGENTRVYLLFGNGKFVDTTGAEHILGIFMERLG